MRPLPDEMISEDCRPNSFPVRIDKSERPDLSIRREQGKLFGQFLTVTAVKSLSRSLLKKMGTGMLTLTFISQKNL